MGHKSTVVSAAAAAVGLAGGPAATPAGAASYTTAVTETFSPSAFAPTSNLAFDATTDTYLEAATQGIFRVNAGRTGQTLVTPASNAADGTGTGSVVDGIGVNAAGTIYYGSNAGLSGGVGGLVTENAAGQVTNSVPLTTGTTRNDNGYGIYAPPTFTTAGVPYFATASGSQNGYGAILLNANGNSRLNGIASAGAHSHGGFATAPNDPNTFYGVSGLPNSPASNLFSFSTGGSGGLHQGQYVDATAISGLTFVPNGTAFGTSSASLYDIPAIGGGLGNTAMPLVPLTAATTGVQAAGQVAEPQLVAFGGLPNGTSAVVFSEPTSAGGTPVINVVQVDGNNNVTATAIPLSPSLGSQVVSVVADSLVLHTTTVNGLTTTSYDATVDVVTNTSMFTLDYNSAPEPASVLLAGVAAGPLMLGRRRPGDRGRPTAHSPTGGRRRR